MSENRSTNVGVVKTSKPSHPSWNLILATWLMKFGEHYRQTISTISAEVYQELLADLSAADLDAACRRAIETSEYMPTVATIRNALRQLRSIETTPSTFIRYPKVTEEERKLSPEEKIRIEEIKKGIGAIANPKDAEREQHAARQSKTIYTPRCIPKSIEEQKAELRKRGFLK